MKTNHALRGLRARAPLAAAVAVALLSAPAVQAFEFGSGDFTGSLDTTVSYGYSWRTQDIDTDLIGKANINPAVCAFNQGLPPEPMTPPTNTPVMVGLSPNPGFGFFFLPVLSPCVGRFFELPQTGGVPTGLPTGVTTPALYFPGSPTQLAAPGRFSVNRDDGDVKYGDGDAISSAIKITPELSLKYKNWGFFGRATYFYDFENAGRSDLTREAKKKVGEDARLLDFFIYHDWDIGDHKASFRFGRQVESWGESTFIQNGINVINPVDVSKLRVAGAELKEAFLPISMITGTYGVTDDLSVEALYMLQWHETEIDASGTYFSSNDFASPGGTYVMLGFGTNPQPVANPELYASTCLGPNASVTNSDLFGSYVSAYGPVIGPSLLALGCGSSVPRLRDRNARGSGQFGVKIDWLAENWGNTEFGFYFLNYHSRLPMLTGRAVSPAALTGTPAGLTAGYMVEYPEDIQLYGMSWNTTIPGGVAWQGELSYRPNMPLQIDDVELLYAALSPLNPYITFPAGTPLAGQPIPAAQFCSQLLGLNADGTCAHAAFGQEIRGWRRHEVSQLQMTFTKAFAQVLGAEQLALVGEIGATEVWDLPDQSVLRYEGEGTDTGGEPGCDVGSVIAGLPTGSIITMPGCLRNPQSLHEGFPTQFSWGYRIAARADYNSVWGTSFNLSPRIAFNHDVNGISPGPGGNFLEGRKSLTVGLEANYLNKLAFDLSYTSFTGAGHLNQISDRDFASFTVKYSF